jgi:ABC-2 type transport system ATP-binding protein
VYSFAFLDNTQPYDILGLWKRMIPLSPNATTAMPDMLIEARSDTPIVIYGLTKVFHPVTLQLAFPFVRRVPPVIALQNVSLTVSRGEIVGLLGTNGAGKTTLLKTLATLVLPTAGQVTIDGWDLVRDAERVKDVVSLMTGDERSFYWRLTGRQNLEFFAAFQGLNPEDTTTRIEELQEQLELEALDRRFGLYSTGMRQRVALARALLRRPSILLLDEPTRSLDPLARRRFYQFLRDTLVKALGCSILLSTHSFDEAESLCDRIAVLHRGVMLTCQSIDELTRCAETMESLTALFEQMVGTRGGL